MKPKIFKPLLVVVAGVALLVVLASIGLNLSRAKHEAALAEKKAALEAKGIPVSLVEVNRRYHEHGRGSEENAARFYEQAFGELNADREAVERLSDLFSGWDPFPSFGKEELRFMRTLVERNQRALALLKEAADYPYLRFALDFTEGSELLPPHISGMRTGAQLLRAEAVIAAEEGRIGEATEAVQAVFRMGLHLSEEPTMLAQLSRVLYEQIGISALELVMSRSELASAVLKVFQEQLWPRGQNHTESISL